MNGTIIFIFIIVLLLSFVKSQKALLVSFICLLWMLSLRTSEIPDTDTYKWMYDDPFSRMDYNEVGYLFLGYIFNLITNADFIVYNIFVSVLCLFLWFLSVRRLFPAENKIGILFLIFLSFYGFFYFGITIRNCLSNLLIFYGISLYLTKKSKLRIVLYLVIVLLAVFIHKSALFFFVYLLIINRKISTSGCYCIFGLCVLVWLFSGIGISRGIIGELSHISFLDKLDGYAESREASPNMLSLQIIMNFFISYFSIRCRRFILPIFKKTYDCFLKINMLGLITMSLIWSIPTAYRFYNMFFFYNFILIYLFVFKNIRIRNNTMKNSILLGVSFVYFAILLYSVPEMLIY